MTVFIGLKLQILDRSHVKGKNNIELLFQMLFIKNAPTGYPIELELRKKENITLISI